MFEKDEGLFPVKKRYAFLAHCGVSPLYPGAFQRQADAAEQQMLHGALALGNYTEILAGLRRSAARLLRTSPDNLAFVKNTSEALSMVANGYPLEPGDQIISYVHEYPANHYPWRLQERRGVDLVLLPDRQIPYATAGGLAEEGTETPTGERPCAWTMADLDRLVTDRTRIVAVSHVQFTSGFAANLKELGVFCRARGIDLVVDAAQSLGCLPVYPEEWNIGAVASSGWKWLLGPVGTGIFYTSEAFREKLEDVMVGAETMVQGMDYLDHSWQPHRSARRFEYSTSPIALAAALETAVSDLFLRYKPEDIRRETRRLQDIFLAALDPAFTTPLVFPEPHRSGILSLMTPGNPDAVARALGREDIVCSARGGYLRVAPHFYNTEEEMVRAAHALNRIAGVVGRESETAP